MECRAARRDARQWPLEELCRTEERDSFRLLCTQSRTIGRTQHDSGCCKRESLRTHGLIRRGRGGVPAGVQCAGKEPVPPYHPHHSHCIIITCERWREARPRHPIVRQNNHDGAARAIGECSVPSASPASMFPPLQTRRMRKTTRMVLESTTSMRPSFIL